MSKRSSANVKGNLSDGSNLSGSSKNAAKKKRKKDEAQRSIGVEKEFKDPTCVEPLENQDLGNRVSVSNVCSEMSNIKISKKIVLTGRGTDDKSDSFTDTASDSKACPQNIALSPLCDGVSKGFRPTSSSGISDYEVLEGETSDENNGNYTVVRKKKMHPAKTNIRRSGSVVKDDENGIVTFFLSRGVNLDPFVVQYELECALKRKNIKISAGYGTIKVEFVNREEHIALCKIRSLDNQDIRIRAPNTTVDPLTQHIIFDVPLSISEETIKKCCKCQSVYRVSRKEGGDRCPTTTVILSYKKHEIPTEVKIQYLIFKPRPYIKVPVRCFNCQLFGHVAKYCLRPAKCSKCSGEHDTRKCCSPQTVPSKCASCRSESHPTGSRDCPSRIRASGIVRTMAQESITYAQAARRLGNPPSGTLPTRYKPGISYAQAAKRLDCAPTIRFDPESTALEGYPNSQATENRMNTEENNHRNNDRNLETSKAMKEAIDDKITVLREQLKSVTRILESSILNLWSMIDVAVRGSAIEELLEGDLGNRYKTAYTRLEEETDWLEDFIKPLKPKRVTQVEEEEGHRCIDEKGETSQPSQDESDSQHSDEGKSP